MKKLSLNKKVIAQLDTIVGGAAATVQPSFNGPPQTCANLNISCAVNW